MNIRKLRLQDYPAADAMMRELHRLHASQRPDLFVQEASPYSREEFAAMVEDASRICLLAEEKGKAIGLCFLSIREPKGILLQKIAHIDDIFVVKEARRQGVAKKLYEEAEGRARATGAWSIHLKVWAFNEPALAFYRSLGMKVRSYDLEKEL